MSGRIRNPESLIPNAMNCQLEAARIAGTRTPSAAASNYQLGLGFGAARIGRGRSGAA
jgi:hypothetical protein